MKKLPYFHLFMLFAIILSGCAGPSPAVTPSAAVPPAAAPSATLPATQAPTPLPTKTFTPSPSPSPSPTPTATVTLTPTPGLGSRRISPIDGMVMVYVPAGEFWMGSDRKRDKLASYLEPYEKLTLDAFWIDQTEVTNAMFARFISATGYQTTAELEDFSSYLDLQKRAWFWSGADWKHPNGPESNIDALGDHPVTQVSQLDAETYCQWAGRFLPSEAQWVKAARGTDSRVYPWGDALDSGELANFADKNLGLKNTVRGTAPGVKNIDDGYQYTAPVGSYPAGASPYGALDMTGNVSEWTTTCFDTPENARVRPQPGMKFCQTKGGSFLNPASGVRAAYNLERNPAPPGNPGSYLGFRCAALP